MTGRVLRVLEYVGFVAVMVIVVTALMSGKLTVGNIFLAARLKLFEALHFLQYNDRRKYAFTLYSCYGN